MEKHFFAFVNCLASVIDRIFSSKRKVKATCLRDDCPFPITQVIPALHRALLLCYWSIQDEKGDQQKAGGHIICCVKLLKWVWAIIIEYHVFTWPLQSCIFEWHCQTRSQAFRQHNSEPLGSTSAECCWTTPDENAASQYLTSASLWRKMTSWQIFSLQY